MELMLVFGLGAELYGLEVTQIQEIVERPAIHYIPRAPARLLGAVNFHGNIIPVLDLATFLGFPPGEFSPRIVVLPSQLCSLALAVHSTHRIVPMDADAMMPMDQERQQTSCIRAAMNCKGEIINILDVPSLLARLEKQP